MHAGKHLGLYICTWYRLAIILQAAVRMSHLANGTGIYKYIATLREGKQQRDKSKA